MASQGSNDDCYFYFYSSCTKGDSCPFRHCEAALGTETVCSAWRQGRCFRSNCKFRHMESRINRATIPCYWENKPSGCRKPHCVFLHQKARSSIHDVSESQELILPVSTNSTSVPCKISTKDQPTAKEHLSVLTNTATNEKVLDQSNGVSEIPSSQPVPFVLSVDEGEESDTESVSSTPMKSASSESRAVNSDSAKVNLLSAFSEKNFGVKTLEQLRMEKIHRESEHFYKSDDTTGKDIASKTLEVNRNPLLNDTKFCFSVYDPPALESPMIVNSGPSIYKQESYPPESEFISLSVDNSTDKSLSTPETDTTLSLSEHDRDLRGRILKRRAMSSFPEKDMPAKRVICLRKDISQAEDSLDFKIKTLDEIRKERESKQGNPEEEPPLEALQKSPVQNFPNPTTEIINSTNPGVIQKPLRKPRIKRQPRESYLKNNSSTVGVSNGNVKSEPRSQMVLHEVQNISEDQNKSSKLLTDEKHIGLTKASGKRKDFDECLPEKSNKILKIDSSVFSSSTTASIPISNETSKTVASDSSPSRQLQRPIIRRNSVLSPPKTESAKSVTSSEVKESAQDNVNRQLEQLEDNETELPSEVQSSKDEICSLTSTAEGQESESRTVRTMSVDEFDHLFNECEVNLDDGDDSADGGAEQLLLQFEQLLES